MTGTIYKHTNKINGKAYVGQTTKSMEERLKGHIIMVNHYINMALNPYLKSKKNG